MALDDKPREIIKALSIHKEELSFPLYSLINSYEYELGEHLQNPNEWIDNLKNCSFDGVKRLTVEVTMIKELCERNDCAYFRVVED